MVLARSGLWCLAVSFFVGGRWFGLGWARLEGKADTNRLTGDRAGQCFCFPGGLLLVVVQMINVFHSVV